MMFKILNGQTPDYLSNKFIFRNDTTNYRLRNSEMRLALPQPRTDYVRKSFSYSGAALWNSLPADIRVSKTLGEFKTKLRSTKAEILWIGACARRQDKLCPEKDQTRGLRCMDFVQSHD